MQIYSSAKNFFTLHIHINFNIINIFIIIPNNIAFYTSPDNNEYNKKRVGKIGSDR